MANNQIALLAVNPKMEPASVREGRLLELAALRDADTARKQGMADDAAVRDVYKNNADPQARLKALYSVNPKAAMAAEKFDVDLNKDRATTSKTAIEGINLRTARYKDALSTIQDRDGAAAWVQAMYSDPDIGKTIASELGPVEAAIGRIPDPATNPQGFAAWKRGSQLGADKLAELSKPVLGTRNLGNRMENTAADPFTGDVRVTATNTIGQSPDSVASNATSRANNRDALAQQERASLRTDSRERLAPRGQIIQTDSGPMLADPRNGTARPVTGPDGASLAPKMKSLPAPIQKALLENDAALRKVGDALAAVEAYPQGLGLTNYLGDGIRQRTDPDGVNVRALVADIGSLKIHDRSGAAVTAAETPRLKPFIPAATDDAATVKKKLRLFEKEYQDIQTDIEQTYTRENGYRAPARGAKPAAELSVGTVEDGYRYKGGDKSKRESWEKI